MIERQRLDGLLFAILGDQKLVDRWWNRKNREFDNCKPIDIYPSDPERIRDYIFRMSNQ